MHEFKKVRFGKTEEAYDSFCDLLLGLVEKFDLRRILDVGGGENPQLSLENALLRNREYTVMDVSRAELERTPTGYKTVVMDIGADEFPLSECYDLVFSRFVAEHVSNAQNMHANVFKSLRPGGLAVHLFPTLFALPFLINKLLPEFLSVKMLSRERQQRGKFPAHYHWCVGPNARTVARFEALGYEVIEYAGFFGHGYYDGIRILKGLHQGVRSMLLRHPVSFCTSFAWVILRKPSVPIEGTRGAAIRTG